MRMNFEAVNAFAKANGTGDEHFEYFFKELEPLLIMFSRMYASIYRAELDDVKAQASIYLLQAMRSFDVNRGSAFVTYAWTVLQKLNSEYRVGIRHDDFVVNMSSVDYVNGVSKYEDTEEFDAAEIAIDDNGEKFETDLNARLAVNKVFELVKPEDRELLHNMYAVAKGDGTSENITSFNRANFAKQTNMHQQQFARKMDGIALKLSRSFNTVNSCDFFA